MKSLLTAAGVYCNIIVRAMRLAHYFQSWAMGGAQWQRKRNSCRSWTDIAVDPRAENNRGYSYVQRHRQIVVRDVYHYDIMFYIICLVPHIIIIIYNNITYADELPIALHTSCGARTLDRGKRPRLCERATVAAVKHASAYKLGRTASSR